jgi:hypothetical protein
MKEEALTIDFKAHARCTDMRLICGFCQGWIGAPADKISEKANEAGWDITEDYSGEPLMPRCPYCKKKQEQINFRNSMIKVKLALRCIRCQKTLTSSCNWNSLNKLANEEGWTVEEYAGALYPHCNSCKTKKYKPDYNGTWQEFVDLANELITGNPRYGCERGGYALQGALNLIEHYEEAMDGVIEDNACSCLEYDDDVKCPPCRLKEALKKRIPR